MDMHSSHEASAISSYSHSIFKVLDQVMIQVEYHCFADLRFNRIDPLFKELCLIIAEVLVLPSDAPLKINGCVIRALVVQDVFKHIRNHHLRLVFDNFQNVSLRVFNKKAYLRTVLYNAFFEYESHYLNNMFATD